MNYVVGFLFDNHDESVLLVRKNKPEWQAGKLNGIGGKIEENEDPLTAMHREFAEETGIKDVDWKEFLKLEYGPICIWFFKASINFGGVKYMSINDIGEYIEKWSYDKLNSRFPSSFTIPNLKWIIPLALDKDDCVANIKGSYNG